MSVALALPEARDIGLDQVRDRLIPLTRLLREEIRQSGTVEDARELGRRLDAFQRLMTDREARALLAAEARRTEVLVGYLLGAAVMGRPAEGTLAVTNDILRVDKHKFRLLAKHEDLVEQFLAAGYVTRRALLDKVASATSCNGHSREPVAGLFTTLVADPPWRYENRATRAAAENHYTTLSIPELCDLHVDGRAVAGWTAPAAHLYLWTTNAFLRQAFDVLDAWGFTYRTTLVWVKSQLGIGNYFRSSHEFVLFGTRGDLKVKDSNQRSWFEAARGRHSAKPDRFYDLVEIVSPGPYLELFGRPSPLFGAREGWTVWGDEA